MLEGGCGELVEKKSRFLAAVRPVESGGGGFQRSSRKGRKNTGTPPITAPPLCIGRRAELTRCSDDGEPSGTAGRPMLEVLLKEGICNTAVVVTRYFGGTLLGTGGLVRAYGAAVKEGLKNSRVVTMRYGTRLEVTSGLSGRGQDPASGGQRGHHPGKRRIRGGRPFCFRRLAEDEDRIIKSLTEATDARARIGILTRGYYAR